MSDRPRTLVRLLGDTLGRVIAEQEGEDVLELVERVRRLSVRAADGEEDARSELQEVLDDTGPDRTELLARAFNTWFRLINLAEEQQRTAGNLAQSRAAAEAGELEVGTVAHAREAPASIADQYHSTSTARPWLWPDASRRWWMCWASASPIPVPRTARRTIANAVSTNGIASMSTGTSSGTLPASSV